MLSSPTEGLLMKDKVAAFATVDPFDEMTGKKPGHAQNLIR